MTVTLAFFLLELILNSLAKPKYICRFSFWLDLAASLLSEQPRCFELIFCHPSSYSNQGTPGIGMVT